MNIYFDVIHEVPSYLFNSFEKIKIENIIFELYGHFRYDMKIFHYNL